MSIINPKDIFDDVTRLSVQKQLKDLAVSKDIMRLAKKIFILRYESGAQTTTQRHHDNAESTHSSAPTEYTVTTTQPTGSTQEAHSSTTVTFSTQCKPTSSPSVESLLSPRQIDILDTNVSLSPNAHDNDPLGTLFSHYKSHIFDRTVQHVNLLEKIEEERERRKVDAQNGDPDVEVINDNTGPPPPNHDELTRNALQMERSLNATHENNGNDSDDSDDGQRIEQKQTIFNFLYCLKQELCSDILMDWDEFDSLVNMNDHETVTKYLVDKFGDDGILTLILKSCHQTIIAKVLRRLREEGLTFKDVRGSWRIQIRISSCGNYVSSLHRRKEQMIYRDDNGFGFDNEFQFEWELETFYNAKEKVIDNVEIRLLEIEKVDETKVPRQKEFKEHKELLLRIFGLNPLGSTSPAPKQKFLRRLCTIL